MQLNAILIGLHRRSRQAFAGGLATAAVWLIAALAVSPGAAAQTMLVMLGDSVTAGYGLAARDAIPTRLETRLRAAGYDVRIVNAGVSGDTTAGGLARLDWSVPRTADGVIVALGANDMLQGQPIATTRSNLAEILTRLKARGQKMALVGMRANPGLGRAYQTAFDGLFASLSKAHGAPLYPFLLDGVALDPRLTQSDGIHPNAAGAEIISARLAPFVVQAFALKKTLAVRAR
jgi:acyl-CoA thioesterase-1